MALRLIETVLREEDGDGVRELLKEHEVLEHRHLHLPDGEILVRILVDAEHSEALLDLLENRYSGAEGNRVVVLPVEATRPRAEPEPEPVAGPEESQPHEKSPDRIGREELYEDIKDAARCSRSYLAMVVLSTIVAAVGLHYDSVAITIGATVIAPLLGPNVALCLGTSLGDIGAPNPRLSGEVRLPPESFHRSEWQRDRAETCWRGGQCVIVAGGEAGGAGVAQVLPVA